jgi:hypothetical protein
MRRHAACGWFENEVTRLRFEHRARLLHPDLSRVRVGRGLDAVIVYRLRVEVPEYDARRIQLELPDYPEPCLKRALADGPTESLHRFDAQELCLWHPRDEEGETWLAKDGLMPLIEHVRIHLFKEGWWRETGEWLGPEYPHPSREKEAA